MTSDTFPQASPAMMWHAAVKPGWHIACQKRDFTRKSKNFIYKARVYDKDLVVFDGYGGWPAILADKCPHMGTPLSLGRAMNGVVECCTHGRKYDQSGICRSIPMTKNRYVRDSQYYTENADSDVLLTFSATVPENAPRATAYHAYSHEDFIWVWMGPDPSPGFPRPPNTEPLSQPRRGVAKIFMWKFVCSSYMNICSNFEAYAGCRR